MVLSVGMRFAFVVLILFCISLYYAMRLAMKGKVPKLRKLPALAAIEEAVGRAAEMGRPVHVCPGSGELTSSYGAETVVGLSVVAYTAKLAVEKGAGIICTVMLTDSQPLAEEAIRSAYILKGKPEGYDPTMVRFAPYGTAYDPFIMGIAERERPAANIIVGPFFHQSLFTIEAMKEVGALSIGGTTRTAMAPFFVGGCDYFLIGEEVMATGAYLTGRPVVQGSFLAQDYAKYFSIIMILLAVVSASLGIDFVRQLLKW